MKLANDVSRKSIQPVVTKKPLITFEAEQSLDQKLGESRTYKLHMKLEEDNLPVYSLTVEVFELSSPKEWLIFKHTIKHVL
eukprot:12056367-Ditylum_brightwellii.AAC.1